MSLCDKDKRKRLTFKDFFAFVFICILILGFFFLPYYHSRNRLAWAFVWDIRGEIVPVVAFLQFVLIYFFLYLLRLQRLLRREQQELASAITNLDVGLYKETPGDKPKFIEINEGFLKMLDYTQEALFSISPKDVYEQPEEYLEFRKRLLSRGSLIKEVKLKKKDGQLTTAMISAKLVRSDLGELQFLEYLVMDVSERKWMEEEMSSAYLRFEAVIQNTPNIAIQGLALDGKILEWNSASEIMFGYTKNEMIGTKGFELILKEGALKEFKHVFEEMKNTTYESVPRQWEAKNKDGEEIAIYTSMFPILQDARVIEIYCMSVDISDHVKTEKNLNEIKDRLEGLALKDAMTEVYNFRYFRERLAAEFERAKRLLSSITIMMIDLDYFKSVNDTHGHHFGDKVLKQVARFLVSELRVNDVVARWGGEEFAVILPDTNRIDGLAVADKILDLLHKRWFGDEATTIRLKCSIGVVSYPEDPLFSVDEIIDAGEQSIYKVKERGGDGVALYGHEISEGGLEKYSEQDRKRFIDAVKQKLSFYAVRSEHSILEAVYSLAKSIELKDRRTREHCDRMIDYAQKLARLMGLNEQEVDNVRRAAMLHDIGKLGISDAILLKPAKLTPEEYEIVKNHPVIGADILSVAGFLKDIIPLIVSHHERYDGTGYPRGLKGEEIPLGARIIAVVDVYEALTSDRPYHKAISSQEALKIIKEGAGTQFDANVVKLFCSIVS
ncbi:MAG: diguanylate cyclase [Candidatus Omnitrophota bacterium]